MYERLGKASVRFAFRYARRRYRREARIALGLVAVAIAIPRRLSAVSQVRLRVIGNLQDL